MHIVWGTDRAHGTKRGEKKEADAEGALADVDTPVKPREQLLIVEMCNSGLTMVGSRGV